jgi:hypothetical protein
MSHRTDLAEQLRKIPAAAALPAEDFNALADTVYTELEYRVGAGLCAELTEAQQNELKTLIHYEEAHPGLGPGGPVAAWLKAHRPHHADTVRETAVRLLAETAEKLTQENP